MLAPTIEHNPIFTAFFTLGDLTCRLSMVEVVAGFYRLIRNLDDAGVEWDKDAIPLEMLKGIWPYGAAKSSQ